MIRSCRDGKQKHWHSSRRNFQIIRLRARMETCFQPPLFWCIHSTFRTLRYELDSREFERSLLKARQDVGPGWLFVRFEDRIWLLRPPLNEVIVIGPGFVATDATDAGVVNTFFVVIRALAFGSLLGEVRPGIRDRVVAMSEANGLSVAWNISTARKPFVAPAP